MTNPLNRTPPADVLRQLREEVGYGCPVPGCGSPYLEWHHFDPPWHEQQHHNPDGMIALCRDHHPQADVGTFTKAQLRQYKTDGKKMAHVVYGKFNWLRNDLIVVAGQLAAIRTPVVLQLGQHPIIWLSRDANGMQLLNVIMISETNTRPVILDNFWQVDQRLKRFECPPSGKKLKVEYENGELVHIEFLELNDIGAAQKKFKHRFNMGLWEAKYPATVVIVKYRTANRKIELRPTAVKVPGFHSSLYSSMAAIDCGVFIQSNLDRFK